jgi:uncharacterized repeat protein (TIGR01451 family)
VPSLGVGSTSLTIRAVTTAAGPRTNAAEVVSVDQYDPNSTPDNGDPTEDDQASVEISALFAPPSGRKVLNAENLPELEWRMVWINSGNNVAIDAQITDPLQSATTYVPGSLLCEARGASSTATCVFDAVGNRVFWQGTIGPDLGAVDETSANNEVVITFRVHVPASIGKVENSATSLTDTDGDGDFDDETTPVSISSSNVVEWRGNAARPAPALSLVGLAFAVSVLLMVAGLRFRADSLRGVRLRQGRVSDATVRR